MGLLSNVLKQAGKSAKDAVEVENIVKQNKLKVKRIKEVDPNKPANPKSLLSKMNAGQKKAYNLIKRSLPGKKLMLYSGAGGLGVGLVVGLLGSELNKKPSAKTNGNGRINPKDYPTYKKGTKSAKAFQEAFKKAVDNNQKTFKFEGRVYNTKTKKND
jgi:hypothetical protein